MNLSRLCAFWGGMMMLLGVENGSADEIRKTAIQFATQTLITNTASIEDQQYLLAGYKQFRNLWIRDLSMSTSGALSVGMEKPIRDSLAAIFSFQREDGLLPRLIDNKDGQIRAVLGVAGIRQSFKAPLKGWYESENKITTIDGNVTAPWAASKYLLKTGDLQFAHRWFSAMEKSLQYLEKNNLEGGLISKQQGFADWEDSVDRKGRVAFTNLFYVLALRGAAQWSSMINKPDRAVYYQQKADAQAIRFREYFWDSKRKILRNFDGDDRLTADANLLAITEKILSPEESRDTYESLRKTPLWAPIPGRPTWPNYTSNMKSIFVKSIGLGGYHDRLYWIWLSSLGARAAAAVGDCKEYQRIMQYLELQIVKFGQVHEVYRFKEKINRLSPFKNAIYRAEVPFTWSSAMFLEAEFEQCRP
jgi:hypothetical protein